MANGSIQVCKTSFCYQWKDPLSGIWNFFLNKRNFSGSKQVLTSGSTEYISAFFLSSFGHWKATDILSVVHSAKSSCVSQANARAGEFANLDGQIDSQYKIQQKFKVVFFFLGGGLLNEKK